jgi:perosamine synthetase
MIPYGKQYIDDDDKRAVLEVLSSDWLTTGPKIDEFEKAVSDYVGTRYAVAVSSGTAALHCAMYALGVEPDDEVIVPCMTFAATANCVVYQGATPVFVDVDKNTLLVDPDQVEKKITSKTKAIVSVDYAGQPCGYDQLHKIAEVHSLPVVADGSHALGAEYRGLKVGMLADMTVFSFHPVKHIATGEGGMVVTDNPEFAERIRLFRNHGIQTDFREREKQGSWHYEVVDLGFNYRITDMQCALGLSQLRKLPHFLQRRTEVASIYSEAFASIPNITPLKVHENIFHAYHLYIIQLDVERLKKNRREIFGQLRKEGIGVNVHYIPVHMHPFYREKFFTSKGLCPVAEAVYERILSIPMYPGLTTQKQEQVIDTINKVVS